MTLAFTVANLIVFCYLWKQKWRIAALGQLLLSLVCTAFLLMLSAAPFVSQVCCELLGAPVFDLLMDQLTAPYWHAVSLPFILIIPVFIGELAVIAVLSSIRAVTVIVRRITTRTIQKARVSFEEPIRPTKNTYKKPKACYLYCTMLC